jgi:MFS family permease
MISLLSFGPRASLGFFLTPMSQDNGWDRDVFGLALAIQNILWGVGQPLAGAIADRYGTVRVLCAGGLFLCARLTLMVVFDDARDARSRGAASSSASAWRAARSRWCSARSAMLLPARWRSLAFGAGTAAGSFGQFLYSPLAVSLMDAFRVADRASQLRRGHAAGAAAVARGRDRSAEASHGAASQSLRQALSEALGHRSYVLLVLGFFTCGFQLAFITIHMPAYLVDPRLSAQVGGWTIAVIGLFQHRRLARLGWLGNLMPKRYILSFSLFRPSRRGARLHLVSGDGAVFDPVRRGHGPALALDGRADQRHHRVDIRHALARDARGLGLLQPSGRGLPRRVARRRRVRAHRLL